MIENQVLRDRSNFHSAFPNEKYQKYVEPIYFLEIKQKYFIKMKMKHDLIDCIYSNVIVIYCHLL